MYKLKTYEEYQLNEAKYFNKQMYDPLITKICDILETGVRLDRLRVNKDSQGLLGMRVYNRVCNDHYQYTYIKNDYIKRNHTENDPYGEDEELNPAETLVIIARKVTTRIWKRKLQEFVKYPSYKMSINGYDIRVSNYLVKRFIYIMENAKKIKEREDKNYQKQREIEAKIRREQEDLEKRDKWMSSI
jgi:hypothetical protein